MDMKKSMVYVLQYWCRRYFCEERIKVECGQSPAIKALNEN